jgi:hypothetical protein
MARGVGGFEELAESEPNAGAGAGGRDEKVKKVNEIGD